MSVYIVSVAGGMCLTKTPKAIMNKKPANDNTQFWTIERKEESQNQIAIRCNADGQYLRAKTGNGGGQVETGAKQWWETEEGMAHGSYWLKCCDFKDAYLCNAKGSYIDNNSIYMWPKQAGWTHALTFYLQDANAPAFLSQAEQGGEGNAAEAAKMMEEVKKREAAVAEKEKQVAKATTMSEEAEKKAKELEEKEKQLTAREKESQAQSKAVEEREKALEEREKALLSNGASGGGDADAKAKQKELETLRKQQQDMSKKLADLEAREKEVAAKERRLAEKVDCGTGNASASDDELAKENKRLAEELAEAKKELADMHQNGYSSTGSRPELKRPERMQPAQRIPGTFSKDLLERFEAGRVAMKGR